MTDAGTGDDDLPPGWTQHFDDNHQTAYWFNTMTGESSWTRPSPAPAAPVPKPAAVDFEPCDAFAGARPGHVFTTGSQGTGYYRDGSQLGGGPTREHVKAAQPTIDIPSRPAGRGRGATMPAWMAQANRANPLAAAASGAAEPDTHQDTWQSKAAVADPGGTSGQAQMLNSLLDRIDDQASADVVDAGAVTSSAGSFAAPCNWVKHDDPRSGQSYYYNILTNETRWEEPADYVEPSSMPAWQPAEGQTAQHGASYADYSASASFNTNSGRFDYSGDGSYWERMGRPDDREGRQMHNFFDISTLENNRKEAEEKKKQLKNVDWRKYKEDRKKRKRLMKERWLHDD